MSLVNLKNFLAKFLPQFLPNDVVKTMLTDQCLKIFERAFTHESYSSNYNYEILEILGDSCITPCFIAYIIKKYNVNEEGTISTLKNHFLSKTVFSGFSREFGFDKLIRKLTTINMSMEEDVFESFCGALRYNGDHYISNYIGQIFVNMFIDWVFDRIEIDVANIKQYQDPVQYLKERYFDNIKTPTGEVLEMTWKEELVDDKFVALVIDKLRNVELGRGTSSDKKEAKRNAARNAISNLKL